MLWKNSFSWNNAAKEAFQLLKIVVTQAPVLALPNFEQPFVIECDASGVGIRAILMQNSRPIAFSAKPWRVELSICPHTKMSCLLWSQPFRSGGLISLDRPFLFEPIRKVSNSYLNRKLVLPSNRSGLPNCWAIIYGRIQEGSGKQGSWCFIS